MKTVIHKKLNELQATAICGNDMLIPIAILMLLLLIVFTSGMFASAGNLIQNLQLRTAVIGWL